MEEKELTEEQEDEIMKSFDKPIGNSKSFREILRDVDKNDE